MKQNTLQDQKMQQVIAHALRIGVSLACLLAFIGGVMYLYSHGGEPMKDYSHFSYNNLPSGFEQYTTLSGIFDGVFHFTAVGWIQLGVICLLLTPIVRVVLSFFDFVKQRDLLYSIITAVVLAVIIANSLL